MIAHRRGRVVTIDESRQRPIHLSPRASQPPRKPPVASVACAPDEPRAPRYYCAELEALLQARAIRC